MLFSILVCVCFILLDPKTSFFCFISNGLLVNKCFRPTASCFNQPHFELSLTMPYQTNEMRIQSVDMAHVTIRWVCISLFKVRYVIGLTTLMIHKVCVLLHFIPQSLNSSTFVLKVCDLYTLVHDVKAV